MVVRRLQILDWAGGRRTVGSVSWRKRCCQILRNRGSVGSNANGIEVHIVRKIIFFGICRREIWSRVIVLHSIAGRDIPYGPRYDIIENGPADPEMLQMRMTYVNKAIGRTHLRQYRSRQVFDGCFEILDLGTFFGLRRRELRYQERV